MEKDQIQHANLGPAVDKVEGVRGEGRGVTVRVVGLVDVPGVVHGKRKTKTNLPTKQTSTCR